VSGPDATPVTDALQRLAVGSSLSREESRNVMALLLGGAVTPAQCGAFLMGLRVKGETREEVAGLVDAMRAASVRISPRRRPLVDLCGTGGDGSGTFNISTVASLVAAGAGAAVAKHGNRAASSRCGSADVLETLGVPIALAPDRATAAIEEHGFAFLFAPLYHAAMRHVGPVRQELKVRTVFNLLGPLSSPAGVERQLVGVYDGKLRGLVAGVLGALGTERAWIVHGEGGLDEMSIAGTTQVTVLERAGFESFELKEISLRPEDFGLESSPLDALRGGDAAVNAAIAEAVLGGERGPHRDAVLLNAAAALVVAGLARDPVEGAERARDSIDSGAARKVLEALRRLH
jgi:anthranilate phosphoribosyltransferase